MFSICKQTHPATGVEHSLSCHFFSKAEKSLVTAGANIIKIFRLIPDIDPRNRNERFSGTLQQSLIFFYTPLMVNNILETRPPKSKLECVAQYNLFGNVVSLQSINLANSPRDALLLAFADAKLSVVEYDPECHDLKTLSLHYFEEDDMKVS